MVSFGNHSKSTSTRRGGGRWWDSVATRMLVPTAVVIVVLVAAFIAQRAATNRQSTALAEQRAETQEGSLAQTSLNLLLDAETGVRGYVITRDLRFLEPWRTAEAGFSSAVAALIRASRGADARLAREIELRGDAYFRDYATPLIHAVARRDPKAFSLAVTLEGKRRMDQLRGYHNAIEQKNRSDLALASRQAETASSRASTYELIGLGAALLLVVWGAFVGIAVVRPIRRVGAAADKLAAGDLSVRVAAPRTRELAVLAGSFNTMAGSLQEGAGRLDRQTAELRRSEAFLDSVLENIPNMIFVKEAEELRFVRLNRAGEELLGHPKDAFIGRSDYDLFAPDEADFFTAKDREVLESGRLLDIPEESIETANGGLRYLHTRKIPLLDEEGKPQYLVGISEDITERKTADDAVRAAKEDAEAANRAKSEFLSRMSHELRTPLNSILGFSQLLEMDELSGEQAEQVHYIVKSGRHLLQLINEVLDLSRIETGNLTMSPEPVAVEPLLTDVLAMIGPLAAERGITLETGELEPGLIVHADQQRLRQVLLNVLSNAVKYNRDHGRVGVTCHRTGPRGRIAVTDTGRGIEPEWLSKLFVPFERLGAEQDSHTDGTGLGLALSYRLVEEMGGKLTVESNPGVGSTFTVELDTTTAEHELPTPPNGVTRTEDRVGAARLLYVEDNAANVKLIQRVLQHRPRIALETAMQGRLGIELAVHHQPDAIVLDLHLPDMSGIDVLGRLRADSRTERIPVIVLSADANPRQAERLRQRGAQAYVTKPIDVPAFLETLDSCLGATLNVDG